MDVGITVCERLSAASCMYASLFIKRALCISVSELPADGPPRCSPSIIGKQSKLSRLLGPSGTRPNEPYWRQQQESVNQGCLPSIADRTELNSGPLWQRSVKFRRKSSPKPHSPPDAPVLKKKKKRKHDFRRRRETSISPFSTTGTIQCKLILHEKVRIFYCRHGRPGVSMPGFRTRR